MSIVNDIKYVKLIGNRLSKFAYKKDYLYNCRCPLCGDSKKNLKRLGDFFIAKKEACFINVIIVVLEQHLQIF